MRLAFGRFLTSPRAADCTAKTCPCLGKERTVVMRQVAHRHAYVTYRRGGHSDLLSEIPPTPDLQDTQPARIGVSAQSCKDRECRRGDPVSNPVDVDPRASLMILCLTFAQATVI
jgi:hypothetical protein